ncbi:unnamed protein product [Rotaria sordida]|uniref:Uncharacterized protein n=1 Tax=Rotaria sordida TaxID=392033 RepID=A0A818RPH8_9BILA|nr:unnamed protein product [Rotaria sordida]
MASSSLSPGVISSDATADDHSDDSNGEEEVRSSSKIRTAYSCVQIIKENHRQQIYAVEINNQVQYPNGILFATVGANSIQIYKFDTNTNKTQLVHAYLDPDANEEYFACAWTTIDDKTDNSPKILLAAGGERGVIRILDINRKSQYTALLQTGAINHLTFAKAKPNFLCTASKNFTVTLWDILSSMCLVVFHGPNGHTDQVLCVDINDQCTMLASASMDRSVFVWSLTSDKIREQIDLAENPIHEQKRRLIKAYAVAFADIEAKAKTLHSHYVDNVQWYGDVLLSRSADNTFCLWQPIFSNTTKASSIKLLLKWVVHEKEYIWFLKFDICRASQEHLYDIPIKSYSEISGLLAIGTLDGQIQVWDLRHHMHNPSVDFVKLKNVNSKAKISRVSFNYDGSILVACSDDSRVFIWKHVDEIVTTILSGWFLDFKLKSVPVELSNRSYQLTEDHLVGLRTL